MRLHVHPVLLLGAMSLLTVAAACAVRPDPAAATATDAFTSTSHVLEAPNWARCWVDRVDTDGAIDFAVTCRHEALARAQPFRLHSVSARVADQKGRTLGGAAFGRPDDADVVIARANADSFPLKIEVLAPGADHESFGLKSAGSVLAVTMTIASPESATQAAPLVVKQPFDLWRVVVLKRTAFFVVFSDSFPVSIAPYVNAEHTSSLDVALRMDSTSEASTVVGHVPAPPSGKLEGTYMSGAGQSMKVQLDHAGIYVAEDDGLRPATEEEAAAVRIPSPVPDDPDAGEGGAAGDGGAEGGDSG